MRFHDLAKRPECDAVAVGETPSLSPRHELGPIVDPRPELGKEARLADSGLPNDGDDLDLGPLQHPLKRTLEQPELMLSADEGRRRRRLRVHAEAARRRERSPGGHGVTLALESQRRQLLVTDHLPRRAIRLLADDDTADRCLALQAGRGVDDVAGGDPLTLAGVRAERDDGIARGDGGSHGQVEVLLLTQVVDGVEDTEGGAHRTLGIVLVRHRRSEDRHHRVADELLYGAAEALDLLFHARVVGTKRCTDILGIGLVGARGEADEVDEEHRDDLPLLSGRWCLGERCSAVEAEAGAVGVLLATGWAAQHRPSLRIRHRADTPGWAGAGYRRVMDEARSVLRRLDRIEHLDRESAPRALLLAELRALVTDAEAWVRVEAGPTDVAEGAIERLREAVSDPAPAGLEPLAH